MYSFKSRKLRFRIVFRVVAPASFCGDRVLTVRRLLVDRAAIVRRPYGDRVATLQRPCGDRAAGRPRGNRAAIVRRACATVSTAADVGRPCTERAPTVWRSRNDRAAIVRQPCGDGAARGSAAAPPCSDRAATARRPCSDRAATAPRWALAWPKFTIRWRALPELCKNSFCV